MRFAACFLAALWLPHVHSTEARWFFAAFFAGLLVWLLEGLGDEV